MIPIWCRFIYTSVNTYLGSYDLCAFNELYNMRVWWVLGTLIFPSSCSLRVSARVDPFLLPASTVGVRELLQMPELQHCAEMLRESHTLACGSRCGSEIGLREANFGVREPKFSQNFRLTCLLYWWLYWGGSTALWGWDFRDRGCLSLFSGLRALLWLESPLRYIQR